MMQRLKLLFYCLTRQLYICHFFGIWLFNNYSSSIALLMVTVVIGVIMFVPLFIRERSDEKLFRVRLAMNQRKPQNNN